MNAKFKRHMEDGRIAPDNNEEYLLYQTILGAWPWQMESQQDREELRGTDEAVRVEGSERSQGQP